MADNVTITAGAGTTIATDDAGAGGHVQIVKLAIATGGSATYIPADATDGLLVNAATVEAAITSTALPVGAGTAAAAGRVTIASDDPTVSPGLSASATFTPAANSHVANDCNGAAASIALAGISGKSVMITAASLEIDGATVEATAWRLMLYNVTPPSAIAEDGAWTYADADRAAFLGFIDLGTAVDHGPNQWIEQNGINKQVRLSGTGVFAYLVNLTTLTPQAVAHKVILHAMQL